MSLHTASKYLASKGRKGDTELVHMTKGEVRGLQQLALAHGGSLSVNPDTGLVEAGILKSVLPMVAGAALTATGVGAPVAALMVGGGMYAATGSIKDGLMAGLGAYGGASLASGIAEAGAETIAEETVAKTAEEAAAETAKTQGLEASTQAVTEAAGTTGETGVREAGLQASQNATKEAAYREAAGQELNTLQQQSGQVSMTPERMQRLVQTQKEFLMDPNAGGGFQQTGQNMWRGLPDTGNVIMENPKAAMAAGLSAFYGSQDSGVQGFPPNQDSGSGGATLSPDFQGYTPPQPNPYYQAQYGEYRKKPSGTGALPALASGGVAGLAAGGMDPMNPMQNPIYPQGLQEHTNFASSTQYPNSIKSAMAADYDARTNPMTGQELPMGMAEGGVARYGLGGIGMVQRIQPGGKWGQVTSDFYGTVNENMPGTLQDMQPGGFMGALQPGRLGYEESQRREEEAKAEEENRRKEMAKQQADIQRWNQFGNQQSTQAGGLAPIGAISGLAAGGIIAMASGTPKTLSRSPGMPDGGVYRDTDPDTYNKDAFTAAQIRLGKINKAAGLKGLTLPKASMTQLGGSFDSVEDKAAGGIAHYNLGGYSDGGRMLKGPGDGMSDSIPASIGGKQAARLADGEFVVPADVVSHLGNGSTDAGAKKLYGMMDKVRKARTGTKKQGKQIKADKYLPK